MLLFYPGSRVQGFYFLLPNKLSPSSFQSYCLVRLLALFVDKMKFLAPTISVLIIASAEAFFTPSKNIRFRRSSRVQFPTQMFPGFTKIDSRTSPSTTSLKSFTVEESSLVLAATEGWRQYVPLVVIGGVILDILLGSPIANLALR